MTGFFHTASRRSKSLWAMAVLLSRFPPRVGDGSPVYVRRLRAPLMILRLATPSDEDAIWDIFRALIAPGDTYVFDPHMPRKDALAYWFRSDTHTYLAESDRQLVGTYILKPNQPALGAHVANAAFMVSPTARGLGVGRRMGEHCLNEARKLGFRAMQFNFVVSTNEPAVRLAISISMQFETGSQPERGAGSPFPPLDPKYPDLPAQKWYEYGFKEGIPRLLDLWDRVGVKVTSHMVGQAVERHPEMAKEIVQRGHEASGHGQTWEPEYSMTPEEERAGYQASIDTIQKATGTRPIGFNAFWLRGTPNTLGILQDLGFIYHIDDISRDEPFTVTVNGKPFAVVSYTIRNNDIVRFDSPATTNAAYLQDVKDDFDVLYAEAASRRRLMSISTHDRISGIPGRVKLIEEFIKYAQNQKGVVFMRKDEIAKWALSAPNIPHES